MVTLAQGIGRFAAEVRFPDLPETVVEKLKVCLYFNLGISMAGQPLVGSALRGVSAFAAAEGGPGARMLVSGLRLSPPDAAFANAVMMHARAQDDFQHSANAHVGAMSVPAAIALAEWRGVNGPKLLAALAVAYQVATVLGNGFTAITTPKGFRASGLYGTPGATAACANLLGLDETAAANAVGMAASCAAGLNQPWVTGTEEWRLTIGQSSRNAVYAALLAEAGNESASDIFEGRYGFYAAHAGTAPDTDAMIRTLRGPWLTETVAFKPLPVCGINQGPARNALALARSGTIRSGDVEAIEIALPEEDVAYPGIAATGPIRSPGAALMRSAYVVSTCLVKGHLKYADLLQRDDPQVLALAERTRVVARPGLAPLSHALRVSSGGQVKEYPYQATGKEFVLNRDSVRTLFREIREELALPLERIDRLEQLIWNLDATAVPKDLVTALIA